jgi:hypothetical protein
MLVSLHQVPFIPGEIYQPATELVWLAEPDVQIYRTPGKFTPPPEWPGYERVPVKITGIV